MDAVRYYAISRTVAAELQAAQNDYDYDEDDAEEGYDEFMAGGSAGASYISYGG